MEEQELAVVTKDIPTFNDRGSINSENQPLKKEIFEVKKEIISENSIPLNESNCNIKRENNEDRSSSETFTEPNENNEGAIWNKARSPKTVGEFQISDDETSFGNDCGSPELPVTLNRKSESLALISSYYGESSDSDSESRSAPEGETNDQRDDECLSSNSEQLDSDNSGESDSDIESLVAIRPTYIPKQLRVKGELGIKDLPPIEDLHISVKEEECTPFGKVYSIVDTLLVVQSLPDKPPLNLESIFFRHNGIPVGKIFDVFGPVKRPFYSVRFNSNEEIRKKGLGIDVVLYAAPDTKHTQYVFANQLMRQKGSDASWVDDCEPPPECLDYSDDDEEKNNRKKQKKVVVKQEDSDDDGSPARKRHLTFEEQMNRNNTIRSKHMKKQNLFQFRRSYSDIGWHNRIDRPLRVAPPDSAAPSNNTNRLAFHVRQPMFIPPPRQPSSESNLPSAFSTHSFSNRKHIAQVNFNPYQPPPNWPNNNCNNNYHSQNFSVRCPPSVRLPFLIPPPSPPAASSLCPPVANRSATSDLFFRCRPPPPLIMSQPMHPRFPIRPQQGPFN